MEIITRGKVRRKEKEFIKRVRREREGRIDNSPPPKEAVTSK